MNIQDYKNAAAELKQFTHFINRLVFDASMRNGERIMKSLNKNKSAGLDKSV